MTDDGQLLQEYTEERSEAAFGELVNRHIDLVYSAALRVVRGDTHLAQDVTQVVFADLARKSRDLPRDVVLPGWLYRHACFTASKAVRTEIRRQTREQAAMEMKALDDNSGPEWDQLAPHLDDSLNELSEPDRDAIVLRFLKRQDLRAVGAALGISEDAAQKRVSRALEKLRELLGRRGVTLTALALGSAISAQAVSAAPVGLAFSVTAASLAGATATGTGAGAATFKLMAMTKLQLGIIGAVMLACVATPLAIQHQAQVQLREENQSLKQQVAQVRQLTTENQRLSAETARLSNLVAQSKTSSASPAGPSNEILRLRGEVARLRNEAVASQNAADRATAPKPLAEMFKRPEMKEYIREQQKLMFSGTIDKNYGPLFASLNLTPEQSAAAKRIIMDKMLSDAEFGMAMVSGEMDGDKKAELLQKRNADKEGFDEQIKQYLGDDNYTRFQAYEKTMPDRTSVTTFKDQLASSPIALSSDQEARLTDAMIEERQAFKFSVDLNAIKSSADPASGMTEEKFNLFQQETEQLARRFLTRAQGILSPEQLAAFGEYQAKAREMQKAMMQNYAKAFSPRAAGN